MTKRYLRLLSMLTLLSMFLAHSAWAAVAGRFQFVAGDVRIVSVDGKERPAIKGGEVNEKETIFSGKTGSAQLRMIDEGIVAVRPETALRIDEYKVASKEDDTERGLFLLLKGGFRSITGLIGRGNKDNYGIRTPSATIGIRGTDHETIHLTTALPNLPEGTYNKVNTGATVINGTLVGANQAAYASNLSTPAIILPRIPPIFESPKGGQQGRDDRKRQDADKTNGKPQAKDEKKEDAGQPPRAGDYGKTAHAPPNVGPMPSPPPQNLLGGTVFPPPPPTKIIKDTSGPLKGSPPTPLTDSPLADGVILAPIGTGVVGGDISIRTEWNGSANVTGPFAGEGSIVVDGPNQTILLDAVTKLPVVVADLGTYSSMQYSAGTALPVEGGQTTLGTALVVWGRYVGADQFVDSQGTRDPITMSFIYTDQAMSIIQAGTYFQSNSHTFNLVPGVGNIVDDLGSIYTATGSFNVSGSTVPMVSLGITASNGTRTWALNYLGTVQQFYQGNCTIGSCGLLLTSSTLTGAGPVTVIKGDAGGLFIGPNAAGALTSYSANAFNGSAPVGSLQGTSLFKR